MKPTRCIFDLYHGDRLASPNYAGDVALFAQAKEAGWCAMLHKLTEGAAFVDQLALGRLGAAVSAGLLVGGYHYMTGEPVLNQVALFMHAVGLARTLSPVFIVMLDFEPSAASTATTAAANSFVTAVRGVTGRWPLLYTGRWDIAPNVVDTNLPACPLMLAEYGSNPVPPIGWANWALHQYSDGTAGPSPVTIPGIGAVDQSEFAGSVDECAAWWNTNGTI